MPRRFLLLTASMGAGHTAVARELARRIGDAGERAVVADLLDLLPVGVGRLLRRSYEAMLRATPWLYDALFWAFFLGHNDWQPTIAPLTVLATRGVRRLLEAERPDVVVSTFHVAAAVTGGLREHGELAAPSVVVVTEPALHELWLRPGNDLYVCPFPALAYAAEAQTGRPALAPGPVVSPAFRRAGEERGVRRSLGLRAGERAVLVSGGSWGVGEVAAVAAAIAHTGRYVPIVLCGHNIRLRERLSRAGPGIALGWQDDMPALMASCSALVDNAGGLTCMEAFAVGLPVVSCRPIPGHGRIGVQALARLGLTTLVDDPATGLAAALDAVTTPGPERDRRVGAARAVFRGDAASEIMQWSAGWVAATRR